MMGDTTTLQDGDVVVVVEQNSRRHLIFARMVLAEMIGTFILLFSVTGIMACANLSQQGEVGLMGYAVTGCVAVVVVVYTIIFANPTPYVVSCFRHLTLETVPIYASGQMLGSILAAFVGKAVYGVPADLAATRPIHGRARAFWAELIATSFVMFLASAVSYNDEATGQVAGLVVGAAIALASMITQPVSGGSMNPARSFGPVVISWRFDDLWLYMVTPTVGAVVGALLFRLVHLHHHQHRHESSSTSAAPAQV